MLIVGPIVFAAIIAPSICEYMRLGCELRALESCKAKLRTQIRRDLRCTPSPRSHEAAYPSKG